MPSRPRIGACPSSIFDRGSSGESRVGAADLLLVERVKANSDPAAGREPQRQHRVRVNLALFDLVGRGIGFPIGIVGVAVNLRNVSPVAVEERKGRIERAAEFIGNAAQVPVVAAALAADDRDIIANPAREGRGCLPNRPARRG